MLYTALSSLLERRDDVSRDAGAVQPVRALTNLSAFSDDSKTFFVRRGDAVVVVVVVVRETDARVSPSKLVVGDSRARAMGA